MKQYRSIRNYVVSLLRRVDGQQLDSGLRSAEAVLLITGILVVLVHVGVVRDSAERIYEFSWLVLGIMSLISLSRLIRCRLEGHASVTEVLRSRSLYVTHIWIVGLVVVGLRWLVRSQSTGASALTLDVFWTETMLSVLGLMGTLNACRTLANRTHNSAILLAGSFLMMIAFGTLLLMMPACRPTDSESSAEWHVALFTATSASCVTGLIVEPTGSYWSPVGHAVIFTLFQVGGLGILTFGAFVAVLGGRSSLQMREARTLQDMLDAETVRDSRRLLVTILLFTLCVELGGAVLLSGLWFDLPWTQRLWTSLFHSVSAFCNAGFSLRDDGFLGMGSRWQVWGPLSTLIILGGLGFPVVYDLWSVLIRRQDTSNRTPLFRRAAANAKLSLNSRLVLWSTLALLVFGAVTWFVLESLVRTPNDGVSARIADSWFQSVTFRTAGFNTVDHGGMSPATKLLAIFLMFIGAAPGSTGGGVKTIVFAVTVLNIRAVFRGRPQVEALGRTIPAVQVSRALAMIAIGLFIVMCTTGLLVIFERQPDRFLDHLYEATSAFATVGVSTGITGDLSLSSRLLICVVMFLGRVGPITLLLAMASPSEPARYSYPEERVNLG